MNLTKRTVSLGLLLAMSVALIGVARNASAQKETPGKVSASSEVRNISNFTTAQAVNHALQKTYITSGSLFGASLPAFVYSAVDSAQTITCPGTSGTCTIDADHWIELQGSTTANDAWACLAVDGVLDPNCGFLDNKIPPDGSWVQITSSHSVSGIKFGTHTVQTFVNSQGGVNAAYYHVNYRVYRP